MAQGVQKVLNDIEKAKLRAILGDIEFVDQDEVDPLRCRNCHQLALYHYIAKCGHVFCEICHRQLHSKKCPVENCENQAIDEISQSMEFEFKVYNLQAHCKFRKNGCEETVSLENFLAHQNKCKLSTTNLLPKVWVPPSGNEYFKQSEEMDNIKKELAKLKMDIAEQMNNKIDTTTLDLNNDIQKSFQEIRSLKEDLAKNIDVKLNATSDQLSQKLAEAIDQDTKQLSTKMDLKAKEIKTEAIEEVEKKIADLKEKCERENKDLKNWVKDICNVDCIHWEIADWEKVQKRENTIYSEVFPTSCCGLKMRCKIEFDRFFLHPSIEIGKEVVPESSFCIFYHRRTLEISLHRSGKETKKFKIVADPGFGSEEAERWMTQSEKDFYYSRCNRFAADSVDIRILIEPLNNLYKDFYSKNGILIWKLKNYKQAREDGCEFYHVIWSEYFYSEEGLRFKVGIRFSYAYIKILVFNVHGEQDESHPQQPNYSVTAEFLQQFNASETKELVICNELKRFTSKDPYFEKRLLYNDFETPAYVNDDSLLIKVSIAK